MTMTQKKMLGGAAACVLFVISLFLKWVGNDYASAKGLDILPSGWLWLIFAAAAAAILVMGALDMELPVPVPPFALAFFLIATPFLVTLAYILEGDVNGKAFGMFIGLIASGAGAALAMLVGREVEG